jgi:hypothetical protein
LRFSDEERQGFADMLSRDRLDHWKKLAAHPNLAAWRARTGCTLPPADEHAVLLHEWNAAVSFSMLASIQILEISLRNHMHKSLAAYFNSENWWGVNKNGNWTASANVVSPQTDAVIKAITVSARRSKGVTPGGVISELSFGFWLALLGQAYDNPSGGVAHWRNCLHKVFDKSGKIGRKDLYAELDRIVNLRNKCAHHEPIIGLNINAEFSHLLHFSRRFSRPTREWIERTSMVPHLVKADWLTVLRVSGRLIGSPY